MARFDRIAVLAVITIMMFAPAVASGQTTPAAWNVGVGYQLLHIPDETYPLGMNFDVAVPIVPSTNVVAEFGFATDDQNEPGITGNLKFYNVAGGARWVMLNDRTRGKVLPFLQVLAGAARTDADLVVNGANVNTGDWAFMLQPGVGVTVPIAGTIGVGGQVDYRRAFFSPQSENEWRFILGLRVFGR